MNEELDIEAGEYVLGTLPADERAAFASRLETDPALQTAVRLWQERLALLDQSAPPVTPRAEVWRAIESAITGMRVGATPADASNVVHLHRRLARWRGAALVAGALAAALAVIVVIDRVSLPSGSGARYVAVVDSDGRVPALLAEIDTAAGVIRVRTLAAEAPPGKSLELWHVVDNTSPRSLGILQADPETQTIQRASSAGPVEGMLAVSVEPEGGSPTGAPTGPVVYTGRLIEIE
jgi:anti-sigma-K factor RskA